MSQLSLVALVFIALVAPPAAAQETFDAEAASARYAEDFGVFWRFVSEEYAYFDDKQADWQRVCSL